MIVYHITTHGHLPGVRLSKRGVWGNEPFPDTESAEAFAASDAGGQKFEIRFSNFRALPEFTGERGRP